VAAPSVHQCAVNVQQDDWQRILDVLRTPSGDSLKERFLTKLYPTLFGLSAEKAFSKTRNENERDGKGGGGLAGTMGMAVIGGGKEVEGVVESAPASVAPVAAPAAIFETLEKEDISHSDGAPYVTVSRLVTRAGISYAGVVNRMNILGIVPEKRSGIPYQCVTVDEALRVIRYRSKAA